MSILCKNTLKRIEPIAACVDELVFLVPVVNRQVTMTIYDKFNKVYHLTGNADEQGKVIFAVASLPPFLLNSYAGIFRAKFSTIADGYLMLGEYEGIEFTIGSAGAPVDDYATEDYAESDYEADGVAYQSSPIDLTNL